MNMLNQYDSPDKNSVLKMSKKLKAGSASTDKNRGILGQMNFGENRIGDF